MTYAHTLFKVRRYTYFVLGTYIVANKSALTLFTFLDNQCRAYSNAHLESGYVKKSHGSEQ